MYGHVCMLAYSQHAISACRPRRGACTVAGILFGNHPQLLQQARRACSTAWGHHEAGALVPMKYATSAGRWRLSRNHLSLTRSFSAPRMAQRPYNGGRVRLAGRVERRRYADSAVLACKLLPKIFYIREA